MEMWDAVIIGSGPAAHTAGIYLARACKKVRMYEGFVEAGGQLMTTTDVENFPGFPEGISGPELMDRMRKQSLRWGVDIVTEMVQKVDLSKEPFTVTTDSNQQVNAKKIILATGATARRLHIKGEDKLWQKGMSACAVCDGAVPIFRNKILVVMGGGDSACEEAHFLTKYGSKVIMLVRSEKMRASSVMQQRVKEHEKIEIMWNSVAVEAKGESLLESVVVENTKDGSRQDVACSGFFYAIGHTPNTGFLEGQVECENGYIKVNQYLQTSVPGVYACGDVQDYRYRQAITAAGTGCMVALEVEKELSL